MNKNHLDIIFDDTNWNLQSEKFEAWAQDVFASALNYLEKHQLGQKVGFAKPININLALSNNAKVQKLNATFRGMDKPTNVLSFANIDDDFFAEEAAAAETIELGDIIVAFETLAAEAAQKNILLVHHFAHLLVHGILHLFGFDHQDDAEADEMESIEIAILQELNISNPYEER